jgi:hypothetical protein
LLSVKVERRSLTLGFFACLECATGLGLLLVPGIVISLLLGLIQPAPETLLLARLAGAALLALGAASWGAGTFHRSPAGFGLLIGVTLYNGLAAAVLVYAALGLNMQGPLIWPATLTHAALLLWCLISAIRMRRHP